MGVALISRSLLFLALVGCYDEPEIQLQVTRPDDLWNLEWSVCHVDMSDCQCEDSLWNDEPSNLARNVAIHVNDDSPRVLVNLRLVDLRTSIDTFLGFNVAVTESMLVRRVDVDGPEFWSCDSGPCEASFPSALGCAGE